MKTKGRKIKMPSIIHFGVRKINLVVCEMADKYWGRWVSGTRTIEVTDRGILSERGDTVCHELVHAMLCLRGINLPPKVEEQVAIVIGDSFHEITVRNPELIRWIEAGCP